MTNSDALRDVLDAEVAKQPRTLIIDLSGLRFMDSSALHVILRANRAMDRQGGVLALACPREPVAKMLRLTAADQLVPVYPERGEASARINLPRSRVYLHARYLDMTRVPVVPTTQARSTPSSACVLARPLFFALKLPGLRTARRDG